MTDSQLLDTYRNGQSEAFAVLIDRYNNELLYFLMRFVRNRAIAEDLFQETFLQIHVSAASFDTSKRFKPWLFTIAANKARDHLRKVSRRGGTKFTLSETGEDKLKFIDLLEDDLPLPEKNAEDAETKQLVSEIVDSLPDHLREVLLLAYFNQFAYKEIAQMLSIPLGTVKSRLHSAVGTFAKLWKKKYGTLLKDA